LYAAHRPVIWRIHARMQLHQHPPYRPTCEFGFPFFGNRVVIGRSIPSNTRIIGIIGTQLVEHQLMPSGKKLFQKCKAIHPFQTDIQNSAFNHSTHRLASRPKRRESVIQPHGEFPMRQLLRSSAPAVVGCCSIFLFLLATPSFAQQRGDGQYRPARSTTSPYLGLLQGNNGPIPNYYSLVRPRLEQQAFNQQMRATTQVQSMEIQALSRASSVGEPNAPTTGNSAWFQQHLHYYPTVGATPSRRR
jgi:hypothetical protein